MNLVALGWAIWNLCKWHSQQHIETWMAATVCALKASLSQSQKHSNVPRLFIYAVWTKRQVLHYLENANDFIFISSLHSPLCFYDPFCPRCSLFVSAMVIGQKELYHSLGMTNIRHPSRRRWSLWPLTLLWGQTDSVIWHYGHFTPYLLITVLALASNCPSGLAFLIEHQS